MTRYGLWLVFCVLPGLTGCVAALRVPQQSGFGPFGTCLCTDVHDRVFFGFDRSNLTGDSNATLAIQSAWLVKHPAVKILVAGNADERGTETYNLALGERRADVARDDLVAQGVAGSRIKTISYGKDCPVAAGNDDAAFQQNRNAISSVQGQNPQNCR